MWCVICDDVLWYGYNIPLLYAGIIKICRIARLYGPDVHTGLPLALGKHPKGVGVNPPFAVFYSTSCLCWPNILIRNPVPVFLSCIPAMTSESMGTCFSEGGVCDMQGNLGYPRPFTAKKYSRSKYFRQYCMDYSSIWVPLVSTWVLRVLIEYSSTQVLS